MSKSKGNLHPKQYEIIKRKQNSPIRLRLSDGRTVPLSQKVNTTVVHDAGLARAIEQEFGHKGGTGDVMVIETDNNHLHESDNKGHRYTFTNLAMPWAKYDELGRRIHD